MIEKIEMCKHIEIRVSNIKKANDRDFIFYIYESLLNSLFNENKAVKHIYCLRETDYWDINFDLTVGRLGDLTWILCKENLNCIAETEDNIDITINEIEEVGSGTTYKLVKYTNKTV